MKLVILGATGPTGLEVVRQAKERGHTVTAFVRNPDALSKFDGQIRVINGDLLSPSELQRVLEGQDAVLSAFGPHVNAASVWPEYALALTGAMRRAKLERVMVLSVAFLFKDSLIPPAFIAGWLFFHDVVVGAARMEDVFMKSGLAWTIARPPRLTDAAYSGKFRIREGHLPRFGFTISRADVANYMIEALEERSGIGKVIGLSN